MPILFATCKKWDSVEPPIDDNPTTNITATISGRIINEKNEPISGVEIRTGNAKATTNINGEFEIAGAPLNSNASFITATKVGYFNGSRTFRARQGKKHFVDIMLIEKQDIGNISAVTGGTLNLQNGATITLPANGIVVQSSGAAYSGTVNVAMSWIDPTEKDLLHKMPGDLRGIDEANAEKILQTYGMLAVELTGNSGEKLQIATGKKAGLKFPLPQKLQAVAPATIALWSFNETTGLWKQEGTATKNGSYYNAEVGHFSWWNADFPYTNAAAFSTTLVDQNGKPLKYVQVYVTDATGNYTGAYGYTDETGFTQGRVPENTTLSVNIFYYYAPCTSSSLPPFNIGPFNANTDNALGTKTIIVPFGTVYTASITGSLKDCSSNPAQSGYVAISYYNGSNNYPEYKYVKSDATGHFNLDIEMCTSSKLITYYAADSVGNNVTVTTNTVVNNGNNSLGAITLCGTHRLKANVINCNNQPVANGYLNSTIDGRFVSLPIKNGVLDFSFTPVNPTPYITYYAVDASTGETSPTTSTSLSAGIKDFGTLIACVTHTISGSVVDCNNQPVNGGYVYIQVDGQTKYAYIVNGSYTVNCTPSSPTTTISYTAYSSNNYVRNATATATINLGGNTLPTITLCGSHIITGKLLDCNNQAPSTAIFRLLYSNQYYYATVNPDGTFRLEISLGSGSINASYVASKTNYQNQDANITVNAGVNNLGNILVCGTHFVKGKLVDCNNNSTTGSFVLKLASNPFQPYYVTTASDGSFVVELNAGTGSAPITYYGVTNNLQGIPINGSIVTGVNNIGNVIVCGTHTVTGTATDCNNAPLTNGKIWATVNGTSYSTEITNGSYSLNFTPPTNNATFNYFVEDLNNNQGSAVQTVSIIPGNNTISNTKACGISTVQFLNYSIDGINYTTFVNNIQYDYSPVKNHYISGNDSSSTAFNSISFQIDGNNIGTNSLSNFKVNTATANGSKSFNTPNNIANFTDVAAIINGFTAGSFTSTFDEIVNGATVSHTLQCSFRVRRKY